MLDKTLSEATTLECISKAAAETSGRNRGIVSDGSLARPWQGVAVSRQHSGAAMAHAMCVTGTCWGRFCVTPALRGSLITASL